MVLDNQIREISKDIDRMLLALQKDTNRVNGKANNQHRSKHSLLGVVGDLSEYLLGTISESTWKKHRESNRENR